MIGHSIDDVAAQVEKLRGTRAFKFLAGKDPATQRAILREIGNWGGGKSMIFAGTNPIAKKALRLVPAATTALTALEGLDIVTSNESLGNKAADALGYIGGGIAGFAMGGGPIGAMIGASAGKGLMDGIQGWTGMDRAGEEKRKLEETLKMLNSQNQSSGVIV